MKKTFFSKTITNVCAFLILIGINNVFGQNAPTFDTDPKPFGTKWVKVDELTDEFNDNSLDSNKWTKSTWNYDVPVEMSADNENSGEWDGYMWIRATLDSGATRWFKTARIMSKAQINYPMYTESRIRAANISAYTTYWLNNGDINNRDEIDIIENNPAPTCGCQPDLPWQMSSQYFQADENKTPETVRNKGNFDNRNLSSGNPLKGTKWNEEFHIFGAYWKDARNVQFYLDGEPAGSIYVGDHEDGNTYNRFFTRDLNIIWDLWTTDADWIGGLANQTDLTNNNKNTMYVDWVRTWQLEEQEFFIENRQTGMRLRTNGSTNDFIKLELVPNTWSSDASRWKMVDAGNGYFHLINSANNKFIRPESSSTDPLGDADGTTIIHVPNTYLGDFTKFKKVTTSATGDYFYLENKATGMYFRPEDQQTFSKIQQRPTSYSGNWTQWQFVEVGTGNLVTKTPSDLIQEVSIANFEGNVRGFSVSPNPVVSGAPLQVFLETYEGLTKLRVYDIQGNLVQSIDTDKSSVTIDTTTLNGIYIIKAETEAKSYIKKFVVK